MKCHTDCAYKQNHECARATVHLIQAKCKDRTILRFKSTTKSCHEKETKNE
ncbi:MAG: hypothetical protein K0R22_3224 [Sporomusa sp.]|nr:hypothetical protein [Sporomusa sp.]